MSAKSRANTDRLIAKLHRWLGIPIAIYALLVAATGLTLLFREDVLAVTVQAEIPAPRDAAALADAARERFGETLGATSRLPREGANYFVFYGDNDVQTIISADGKRNLSQEHAYIRLFDALYRLHVHWLLGPSMAWPAAITATLWALVLIAGGVLAWRRRKALKLRHLRPKGKTRGSLVALHQVLGAIIGIPLLAAVLTGIALELPEETHIVLGAALGGGHHEVHAHGASHGHGAHAVHCPAEKAVDQAKAVFPDARPTLVYWPNEERSVMRVRMRHEGQLAVNGRTAVYMSPADCSVLHKTDGRIAPVGDRVSAALYTLHAAKLGRPILLPLLALVAAATLLLTIVALMSVVRRSPKQRQKPFAAAEPRAS